MSSLTSEERKQLRDGMLQLQFMASIVNKMLATPAKDYGLDDLVPTGRLGETADKIRANSPISQEEFDRLVALGEKDIEVHSRLDGFLKNLTEVAKVLKPIALGLIA